MKFYIIVPRDPRLGTPIVGSWGNRVDLKEWKEGELLGGRELWARASQSKGRLGLTPHTLASQLCRSLCTHDTA